MRDNTIDAFLALVRLGIGHQGGYFPNDVDWSAIETLAEQQGLSAIVLDGIERLPARERPPQDLLLEWIGEVLLDYEQQYERYKQAIADLAGWHHAHGFKMMVLKGYACSLDWPKPAHRPCGDIDIWQFGQQKEADALLESVEFRDESSESVDSSKSSKFKSSKIEIDNSHHHHTVFDWQGFTVENHYDFVNVYHSKSNAEIEKVFKSLGRDDSCHVDVLGEKVYLPSPNLHALFLLRHAMIEFAATSISMRQVMDWAFFVEKHTKEIDWSWLTDLLEKYHMRDFYHCINAICVEDLGFNPNMFPSVQFLPALKERVLNDIFSPEFAEKEKGGFIRRAIFKYRRWRANEWKHELCYKESMWSAFWSGVWNHILKPSSI